MMKHVLNILVFILTKCFYSYHSYHIALEVLMWEVDKFDKIEIFGKCISLEHFMVWGSHEHSVS